MRVALLTQFVASRKEPLIAAMDRVHQGFLDSGLGEPAIRFNFGDGMIGGGVSSVDRVLKRHPELERFVTSAAPMPGIAGARRISNGPMSAGSGESVPYATLQAIASGVPRSFPFHSVAIHFYAPEFGDLIPTAMTSAATMAGVLLGDSWWVNGRNRALTACTVIESDAASKKLPPLPPAVATVLAACGKVKRTVQAPLADKDDPTPRPAVRLPGGQPLPSAKPEAAHAVREIVVDYRARLKEIVERAGLPHELPGPQEAARESRLTLSTGPKKPDLERVFKPMGYSCKGESGTFHLRRRTAANLTLEISLDVGTWSHRVMGMFSVWGLGFKGTLLLPVAADGVIGGQYPIGNAERWSKIVENLGAVVTELERTFVPAIEAAVGPSPEWYQPES